MTAHTGTPDSGEVLLRVEELTVRFAGAVTQAVAGVSFELDTGECVAIVGESGAGKSLTARALLGLLPAGATATGTLQLCGTRLPIADAVSHRRVRGSRIALIPQDALGGLDPLRRVEHEVGDVLRIHRLVARRRRRARVLDALADAGMPQPAESLRRRSEQLSGGLRQRALIAAALVGHPELLIADEPTTALDAAHRDRIVAQFRRHTAAGGAVLLLSHDLANVRALADTVLVMRDGRIIERGDPHTVFTAPTHEFTRQLIAADPAGTPRGVPLLSQPRTGHAPGTTHARHTDAARSNADSTLAPNAAPTPPILELRQIEAAFGGAVERLQVLRSVSLWVRSGETVGLVGNSGAGKTTLLRVALGLHRGFRGQVLIDGHDRRAATRTVRSRLHRRLAFVPQDPLAFFPRASTGAMLLADALRAAAVPRHLRGTRIAQLADEVSLRGELLHRRATELSGGERQRLALARALALRPALILLDEPVSALDLTVQARLLDLLDALQRRHGIAYLLVSHDSDVIEHMSDRVMRLASGRIEPVSRSLQETTSRVR